MAVNLKFSPLRRSQGSILFTIKFCDKSFKLKALITIGSFTPLRTTVPMNTCCPLPTVMPPVSWYPVSVFLSSDCVTSVIFFGILKALEHRIIFHTSHALRRLSSPFRLGRPRAHWPEIALSEAFHRSEQLRRNQHPTTPRNFPSNVCHRHSVHGSHIFWTFPCRLVWYYGDLEHALPNSNGPRRMGSNCFSGEFDSSLEHCWRVVHTAAAWTAFRLTKRGTPKSIYRWIFPWINHLFWGTLTGVYAFPTIFRSAAADPRCQVSAETRVSSIPWCSSFPAPCSNWRGNRTCWSSPWMYLGVSIKNKNGGCPPILGNTHLAVSIKNGTQHNPNGSMLWRNIV